MQWPLWRGQLLDLFGCTLSGLYVTPPVENFVDLRSDTVTQPSAAMRHAMAVADVGDDRYGEDPSVNRLEEAAAELTGKAAAAYLPTGRLCNQIAMHLLTRPGHLVVCEESAHVGGIEAATAAALPRIAFRRVKADRGLMSGSQVAMALEPDPYDVEVVDLVTVENTHQLGGGSVLPRPELTAIAKVCFEHRVRLYLDGARIFNACVATGAAVAEYAAQVDALMFCLSKGLGAPVGSLLVGGEDLIAEARRLKVIFGAGWRQAGIMAAAGSIALTEGPKRLHEDHIHARRLAEGIAEFLPDAVDPATVQTNIVFADVSNTGHDAQLWQCELMANGLLVTRVRGRVRMLTHADVGSREIDAALSAWRQVAAELAPIRRF